MCLAASRRWAPAVAAPCCLPQGTAVAVAPIECPRKENLPAPEAKSPTVSVARLGAPVAPGTGLGKSKAIVATLAVVALRAAASRRATAPAETLGLAPEGGLRQGRRKDRHHRVPDVPAPPLVGRTVPVRLGAKAVKASPVAGRPDLDRRVAAVRSRVARVQVADGTEAVERRHLEFHRLAGEWRPAAALAAIAEHRRGLVRAQGSTGPWNEVGRS